MQIANCFCYRLNVFSEQILPPVLPFGYAFGLVVTFVLPIDTTLARVATFVLPIDATLHVGGNVRATD